MPGVLRRVIFGLASRGGNSKMTLLQKIRTPSFEVDASACEIFHKLSLH
jgi:hypothetical protein